MNSLWLWKNGKCKKKRTVCLYSLCFYLQYFLPPIVRGFKRPKFLDIYNCRNPYQNLLPEVKGNHGRSQNFGHLRRPRHYRPQTMGGEGEYCKLGTPEVDRHSIFIWIVYRDRRWIREMDPEGQLD